MANITIRNLDDDVKMRLRMQAAENGHSMEEEARRILREAVRRKPSVQNLARSIRAQVVRRWAVWNWSCHRAGRGANRPVSTRALTMFLLDTNIVSELMRLPPNPGLESWIADHPADSL